MVLWWGLQRMLTELCSLESAQGQKQNKGAYPGWRCLTSLSNSKGVHKSVIRDWYQVWANRLLLRGRFSMLIPHITAAGKRAGLYHANVKPGNSKSTTGCTWVQIYQSSWYKTHGWVPHTVGILLLPISSVKLTSFHYTAFVNPSLIQPVDQEPLSPKRRKHWHQSYSPTPGQPSGTLPFSFLLIHWVTLTPILQPCRSRTYLVWWLPEGLQCSWRPSGITESRGQRLAAPRAERSRRASANTSRTWGNLPG